jgi:phage terminase large subunit
MPITIPYKPRNWSLALHDAATRWIVMVLHRRAGKTTAVLNHLQRDCIRTKDSQYAYIGPSYTQVKLIAWAIAQKISRDIPGVKYNSTAPFCVTYPNGSKLYLLGSENPDSLRGMALWGAAFDEYSQQPSNVFTEVVSKALADHRGYAIFFGTPKGKNEFYRLYEAGTGDPAWTVVFKTIDDSLQDETGATIENLRQALEDDRALVAKGVMTQDEFNQEWYCSFEAAIKGAYYAPQIAKARQDGRIKSVPYDPDLPVHIVSDLGVGPAFATGFYQKSGSETRKIDFMELSEKDGIPQAIAALQAKPYIYGTWYLPHDAEAHSIDTGKTRVATIKSLWPNINVVIIPKLSVDDGIAKGRAMWSRLWVDEKANTLWLDYIAQYHQEWDDNRGMFLEKPYHDFTSHAADEFRGAAVIEDLMDNNDFVRVTAARARENRDARRNAAKDVGV